MLMVFGNMGERCRDKHSCCTQSGYTLSELIVVIIIISLLATLVVVIPSELQKSATDQERVDDATIIVRQLEMSYNNQTLGAPAYPSTQEMIESINNANGVMKGIETEALRAPDSTTTSSVRAATSASLSQPIGTETFTADTYVYQPLTKDNLLCTTTPSVTSDTATCVKFNFYYYNVVGDTIKKITSIRQQ